ncbi:MAG: haloacid dehalogenase type II [Burkholderiaceae bacterium]|jgi:2-haloacid dehalogenase
MKILAFDVFGTVVDWYGSIVREVAQLGLDVDPGQFALDWRAGYQPAMARVRSGELGWTRIDDLHRMILDDLLVKYRIEMDEPARRALNLVWHRLRPWPDAVEGLTRLKSRFTITTLSNGNISLLTEMAKRAGLPWDCILSAEVFRHYKPDPETYLGVCRLFEIDPEDMMLVAAHKDDLDAARALGCRTAFVERPHEFGPNQTRDLRREPRFDFHARNFQDLADQLSC